MSITVCDFPIQRDIEDLDPIGDVHRSRGRSMKSGMEVIRRDLSLLSLYEDMTMNRDHLRWSIRAEDIWFYLIYWLLLLFGFCFCFVCVCLWGVMWVSVFTLLLCYLSPCAFGSYGSLRNILSIRRGKGVYILAPRPCYTRDYTGYVVVVVVVVVQCNFLI